MMTKSGTQDANLTEWSEQPREQRDWKKAFLVGGLALLSWVATYVGMLELIEANMGDLPLVHKIIIGFSVAMLMTMIVWLLDQMFQPVGALTKALYFAGYVFLSIISVGFGFGFYWKVLESKGEGTRVAETAVSSVQAPLQTAAARLESLSRTLDSLAQMSAQKAEQERTAGTSCPNSKPGDGPRRRLRDDDATRFSGARDFVKGRVDAVKADVASIDAEFAKIAKNDASIVAKDGTRNEFMKQLNRRLDQTVTNFNAFKGDPQLKAMRAEMDERAAKTQFLDTTGKPYACPDPGLASMIKAVIASVDGLPTLERPKIATVEGSDATIEAFRRLTATFIGALSFKLPPSAEELRELQKKAVASADLSPEKRAQIATAASLSQEAGLSKRDYIPLSVAIFVDLCLLLVSMARPSNRLGGLVPKMKAAEQGPVIQILSRFNEIHKDPQIRSNFEIFRHVVFDLNGDYYVAVPLDAPPRMNPRDREELRLEAHLLGNLFTSFEQEKIFTRVLMPYISVKQIQKKLWKQGSKFAHAETFRLYKFKDGAYSEIILGAIMGAAKRVEQQKRVRRVEEELFTRHEPNFGGAVSHTAAEVAQNPVPPAPQHVPVATMTQRPVPPPPPFIHRPQPSPVSEPISSNVTQGPTPAVARATPSASTAAAFGPYAAAMAATHANHDSFEPSASRPTHEVVADLQAHRQRVEAQSEIEVRPANSNTAPAFLDATPVLEVETPTVALEPTSAPVPADTMPANTMTVEAVERRVTYRLPARDGVVPTSLEAMLTTGMLAAESVEAPQSLPAPSHAIATTTDVEAEFAPSFERSPDDTPTIASRFAPART